MQAKICSKCKKEKTVEKFYKNRSTKDGYCAYCKLCQNRSVHNYHKAKKDKIRESKNKYRRSEKGRKVYKNIMLKFRYGITLDEYNQLFKQQNGTCAVCNKPEVGKQLAVDHSHKTGKVRGLLCMSCNLLLRGIEDKDFVKKAKNYLRNHSE